MPTNQPDLPTRLETERALFGCLMLERIPMTAARVLRPEDFSCAAHATIFATLCQLEADGLPVQLSFLTTRLERSGQLEQVGGAAYLASFTLAAPTTPATPAYINRVRQAARAALPDSAYEAPTDALAPDPSTPAAWKAAVQVPAAPALQADLRLQGVSGAICCGCFDVILRNKS